MLNEISAVLREWGTTMRKLLQERKYSQFDMTKAYINSLLTIYRQLLSQSVSQDGLVKLRKEASAKIDEGNRLFGLDVLPRDDKGVLMDEKNSTFISPPPLSLCISPHFPLKLSPSPFFLCLRYLPKVQADGDRGQGRQGWRSQEHRAAPPPLH